MTKEDSSQTGLGHGSDVSLGLVGVPTLQEPVQTADKFQFDFDPSIDLNVDPSAGFDSALFDGQSLSALQAAPSLTLQTDFEPSGLSQPIVSNEQYCSYPYDLLDGSSYDLRHNFAYPEPQDYYSAHETPYFDNHYGNFGLTAIPGSNAFAEYGVSEYASTLAPYQAECLLPALTGCVPAYAPYHEPTIQFAENNHEGRYVATTSQDFTVDPVQSTVDVDTQYEPVESGSDSDEDFCDNRRTTTKKSKQVSQKKSFESCASSASTSAATPAKPIKYQSGEKPQKVDAKPWIRTNNNTEGDTRTAKINNWKNRYEYMPLPIGPWSSGKHTFKYTQYENVDFLTEAPMSTRKIKEYIMNYPANAQTSLVLWIQKMPADQGRRYGSKQHSKCTFRDCPIQRYVEGTISTGEYRVAFDEKHNAYGDKVDPYDCTAYAHLYCMEQFLDFEQVCQVADVRVDTRLDMPLEPNGRAAFSMVDVPARHEMERFVKAASKGKLRMTKRWHDYPVHADYGRDQQKPHERTLTYLAHCMYEAHQDDSHKKQAALRRVTVSQRRVHLGDLEMSVANNRITIEVFGGKKKGRHRKYEDHYDQRIRYHIARAEQEARDFLELKRAGRKSAQKGKKRKVVERDQVENDQFTYDSTSDMHRASRHKKKRVNYAESPIDTPPPFYQAAHMQHRPAQHMKTPEHQVDPSQACIETDFDDIPGAAQTQSCIDPTFDTPYGLYAAPITPKFDISDFSNFPTCEDDLPDDNLERLLALERRQSCMTQVGPPSILKSPVTTRDGRTPRSAVFRRRAMFGAQPVSQSKEYRVNDPPSLMSGRRSARLAAKMPIDERRLRKRTWPSREVSSLEL